VPIELTVLLVVAAVLLLVVGFGSTGGVLRFVTGGSAVLIAVAATAAAIYLFWIGQKANWTSDGPGMLFVMIAIVVCAMVAVFGWLLVFGIASTLAAPGGMVPGTPTRFKHALRLLGFALLAVVAVDEGIKAFTGRGRAAHSSPVIAVSFAGSRARLVTVDVAGTLVDWDLESKRAARRETIPELAGATAVFVDATADRGFAVANGSALTFEPFRAGPVRTIPDARHIARGSSVVVAKERALAFLPYSDWPQYAYREMPWPQPITAIAANPAFIAVADPVSVSLLDGRPRSERTLASVPAPRGIISLEVLHDGTVFALGGSGVGWEIDVRRGRTEPLPAEAALVAVAQHVYFASTRDLSEYDRRRKTATRVAKIGAAARSIDTWDRYVAVGLEDGEVVLGTRFGPKFETERLTTSPKD
jgi:hypothetical protein